ncbi:hypothetical protein DPMN_163334 [Dreissena polymorpha]|uniref:Uncharacterized protein n=1 Tax=Dreissena polymorpha TaxID=45954 RepID=A0A9D4ET14_DREPO|nr:hypothetical protein DPMN_163334 [Dreissena polymorpha]
MIGFNIYKGLLQGFQEPSGKATTQIYQRAKGGLLQDSSGHPSELSALFRPVQPFLREDNA